MQSFLSYRSTCDSISATIRYDGRYDAFRTDFCVNILGADFRSSDTDNFQAAAVISIFQEIRLLKLEFSSGHLNWTIPSAASDAHTAGLVLACDSDCSIELDGAVFDLNAAVFSTALADVPLTASISCKSGQTAKLNLFYLTNWDIPPSDENPNSQVISDQGVYRYVVDRFDDIHSDQCPAVEDILNVLNMRTLNGSARLCQSDDRCFRMIFDVVTDNIRNPDLDVDLIANKCGFSRRKIYSIFSKKGMSLRELITRQRLVAARKDIELGREKVASVIADYGFSNASTFYRNYKKEFGIVPRRGL